MEIWCREIRALVSLSPGRVDAFQGGSIRIGDASSSFYAFFVWDTSANENPKLFCSIEPVTWGERISLVPKVFQHLKPELMLEGRDWVRVYRDTRLGRKICAEGKMPLSAEEQEMRRVVSANFALKKLEMFVEDFARDYARQWSAIAERVVATENEAQLEPQLFALELAWTKTKAREGG